MRKTSCRASRGPRRSLGRLRARGRCWSSTSRLPSGVLPSGPTEADPSFCPKTKRNPFTVDGTPRISCCLWPVRTVSGARTGHARAPDGLPGSLHLAGNRRAVVLHGSSAQRLPFRSEGRGDRSAQMAAERDRVIEHQRPITVVLVDDEQLFRSAVGQALVGAGLDVIGEAASMKDALEVVVGLRPDVVLLDIGPPDSPGVHTVKRIGLLAPASRILILTRSEQNRVVEAIVAGASGYILKNAPPQSDHRRRQSHRRRSRALPADRRKTPATDARTRHPRHRHRPRCRQRDPRRSHPTRTRDLRTARQKQPRHRPRALAQHQHRPQPHRQHPRQTPISTTASKQPPEQSAAASPNRGLDAPTHSLQHEGLADPPRAKRARIARRLAGCDEAGETGASQNANSCKQEAPATGSAAPLPLGAQSSHDFAVASPASGCRCRTLWVGLSRARSADLACSESGKPAMRRSRAPFCQLLRPQARARWDHGRPAAMNCVDDLPGIDALKIDPAPRGAMRKEMTEGTSHPCWLECRPWADAAAR